jgi:hypothetical protein
MAIPDQDNGLVIFIRRMQINDSVLRNRLEPYLLNVGIGRGGFDLHKPKTKGIATLHVTSRIKGELFLASMKQYPSTLSLSRFRVDFERHENQDGGAMLKDRKFVDTLAAGAYTKMSLDGGMKGKAYVCSFMAAMTDRGSTLTRWFKSTARAWCTSTKTFNLSAVNCGNWRYGASGSPVFVSEYSSNRPGKLLIGSRSIVAVFSQRYSPDKWAHRIYFGWNCIDMIYIQRGRYPSLMITCKYAPKMIRRVDTEELASPLRAQTLRSQRKKARIPCLDIAHGKVAGASLTYELVLEANQSLRALRNVVEHIP